MMMKYFVAQFKYSPISYAEYRLLGVYHLPMLQNSIIFISKHSLFGMTAQQSYQGPKASQFQIPLPFMQPLWKRVNPKNQDSEQQPQSPLYIEHEASSRKSESGFSRFLAKTHNRISESYCGTESEIMEKMSIDWDEDEGSGGNLNQQKSIESSKLRCKRKSLGLEVQAFWQARELKRCKKLQQFIELLSIINSDIHQEIVQIKQENQKLKDQRKCMLYRQNKMEVKVKLLQNELQILQNKNQQAIADLDKYKKEVNLQSKTNEDKWKLHLEKKIAQIRKDYEAKIQKISSDFETNTTMTDGRKVEQTAFNDEEQCEDEGKSKPCVFRESVKALNMSVEFRKQKENGKHMAHRQKSKAKRFENGLENIICKIIKPSTKSLRMPSQQP